MLLLLLLLLLLEVAPVRWREVVLEDLVILKNQPSFVCY